MASTISIPTAASLGSYATEVNTAAFAAGDPDPRVATSLIAVATAASTDIAALQAGTTIVGVNGTTVNAGGALSAGQVLRATGASAAAWGTVDLANSAAVTGTLRANNIMPMEVRGVATTNVANLAAFVIAGFDGVTYAQGDWVLLANQTTGAQSGVYEVGAVSGTAPLTRVAWLPTGAIVKGGFTVHASEGTIFGNTSWFISTTGAITIGTTAHLWFPESVTISQALTSGTATAITSIPLLSATKSNIVYTRTTVSGTLTNTVSYQTVPAPTAGVAGVASIVPMATVAAGTIQNQDASTLLLTVINR